LALIPLEKKSVFPKMCFYLQIWVTQHDKKNCGYQKLFQNLQIDYNAKNTYSGLALLCISIKLYSYLDFLFFITK